MEYGFFAVKVVAYTDVWGPDLNYLGGLNKLAQEGWRIYGDPAYVPLPAPGGTLIYTLERKVPSEARITT